MSSENPLQNNLQNNLPNKLQSNWQNKLSLVLRLVAAAILLQTLFFKFTGASESIYIFSQLGAEPWGRWGTGIGELIASALLLSGSWSVLGALMTLGVMAGALLSHLFILGIVVQDDNGLLFTLACTAALASLAVLVLERKNLEAWLAFGKRYVVGQGSASQ